MSERQEPLAVWRRRAASKYIGYCTADGYEVSGLGLVTVNVDPPFPTQEKDGKLEILFPPGTVFSIEDIWYLSDGDDSRADTEVDPEKAALLLYELSQAGINPGLVKLWWHKHPTTSWSSVDDDTAKTAWGMDAEAMKWTVSAVWTPQGVIMRYDQYVPRHAAVPLEVSTVNMDSPAITGAQREITMARALADMERAMQLGKVRFTQLPMFDGVDPYYIGSDGKVYDYQGLCVTDEDENDDWLQEPATHEDLLVMMQEHQEMFHEHEQAFSNLAGWD